MEMKLNRNVFLKAMSLLLCFYIGIVPFFQPKKVKAVIGVDDAILATVGVISTALFASGYIQRTVFSQEDLNKINAEVTTNLQTAFPEPKDYDEQLNIFQNINHKLLNGEEVDWSKYSGKALYAVLKGVVDVVWPYDYDTNRPAGTTNMLYMGETSEYAVYLDNYWKKCQSKLYGKWYVDGNTVKY
ncbi:MAG: hypothetical protein Q4F11_10150, partial [Eubacteriales bacterium]|nr:hypothetical protein [Eubacteriales bacterium]